MRRVAMLTVALAVAVAACTPGDGDGTTTTVRRPAITTTSSTSPATTTTLPPDGFGGELALGVEYGLETLNPFAPGSPGTRLAGNAIWATVYDIDPGTWDRIPDVVTAMPSASGAIEVGDDGTMTVRYEIRPNATWSDGVPITGDDLAFTAEAMRDMALAGEGNVADVMATVVATDAVDRLAYITFAEPTLAFEDALWIVLPKHALEGVDLVDGTDGTDWPSGGPFVVDTFQPFDEVRFVRNQRYGKVDDQGRALPHLDSLTISVARDGDGGPTSPAGDFVARAFDVATLPPWEEGLDRIIDVEGEGAVLEVVETPVIEHITFEFAGGRDTVNDASLNDALDYRRAVAMAIDRRALLDETGVPWFPDVPGMLDPVGTSAWERYAYDPAAAADLVATAAGDGDARAFLSTTGNGDYRIRIGDALAGTFDAIGVTYEPIYLDSVLFFGDVITDGTFDLGMWAWISDGGYGSQLMLLESFDPAVSPPDGNWGRWSDGESAARYSEIVTEARATVDPSRFEDLIAEAEEILADQVVLIPLFSRGTHTAWWSDTAIGIVPNGSASDVTWNVETWQRAGE